MTIKQYITRAREAIRDSFRSLESIEREHAEKQYDLACQYAKILIEQDNLVQRMKEFDQKI